MTTWRGEFAMLFNFIATSPKKIVAAMLFLAPVPGFAQNKALWCDGKITDEIVYSDGSLTILSTYRNDWTQICNVQAPWNGISTDTCKNWAAKAMTAVTTKSPVTIQYGSVPSSMECSNLPTYTLSPAPNYFMLRSTQQ